MVPWSDNLVSNYKFGYIANSIYSKLTKSVWSLRFHTETLNKKDKINVTILVAKRKQKKQSKTKTQPKQNQHKQNQNKTNKEKQTNKTSYAWQHLHLFQSFYWEQMNGLRKNTWDWRRASDGFFKRNRLRMAI